MSKGWFFLLLTAVPAHAASFDCQKARTPQEIAICSSPLLSALDDKMSAAYRAALAAAPAQASAEIQNGQLAWIRGMTAACPSGHSDEDHAAMADCLNGYEGRRTAVLDGMVQNKGGMVFVWESITLAGPPGKRGVVANDLSSNYRSLSPGILNASWPNALSDDPSWQAWNLGVKAAVQRRSYALHNQTPIGWQRIWAKDADSDVTVSLGLVGQRLITATIQRVIYDHRGGGGMDSLEFNWLLDQRRELRPGDVFRADSGWEREIEERCNAELTKQLGAEFHPGADVRKFMLDPENWHVDDQALAVEFPDWMAQCKACDAPEVRLPWSELKPYLVLGFQVPQKQ